jgi:hypothetical protein
MQKLVNFQAIKSTNEVKIIYRQINDLEGIYSVSFVKNFKISI